VPSQRKDFVIYEGINFIHCLYHFEGWEDSLCSVAALLALKVNHVSSMLFFLDEFCEHNAKIAACTSQPCTWNKPSTKRKVDNHPIHQVKFVKHEPGKKMLMAYVKVKTRVPHIKETRTEQNSTI